MDTDSTMSKAVERVRDWREMIYYVPGLAEDAPKRNVILLLIYLFLGLTGGTMLFGLV